LIYFRPLPGLTIATLLAFALAVSLGVWQVQRLHWKENLIATAHAHFAAPAVPLDQALKDNDAAQYRHVTLNGHFDHDKEVRVFATGEGGKPVYHVITPFLTPAGTFFVDRGIVPEGLRDPATRKAGQVTGEQIVTGVWRTPDAPGLFTPPPDLKKRIWYARDVAGIAKAVGVKPARDVLIEAGPAPSPGGWPKGGQTRIDFPNSHLQYAGTWFLLACVLLAVYVAFHISRGRLSFGR
jgi:surfeit locus 1 family protein